MIRKIIRNQNTVKSQFVAAVANFFGDLLLLTLFDGSDYKRATFITKVLENYVKLIQKWTILAILPTVQAEMG